MQGDGRRFSAKRLVFYVKKNEYHRDRLGITVSRRIGNAVVRNHVKRRIRESFRRNEIFPISGMDLVVIARPRAASASQSEIREDFMELGRFLTEKRRR